RPASIFRSPSQWELRRAPASSALFSSASLMAKHLPSHSTNRSFPSTTSKVTSTPYFLKLTRPAKSPNCPPSALSFQAATRFSTTSARSRELVLKRLPSFITGNLAKLVTTPPAKLTTKFPNSSALAIPAAQFLTASPPLRVPHSRQ